MADGNPRGEGGNLTQIDVGLIQRAAGAMKAMVNNVAGFFTPVPPQPPIAQDSMGRQFDYSMGFNINTRPRADEGNAISFQQLRQLADNFDLMRLVIETRKDQLCGLSWNIVGRDDNNKVKADDPRVKELEAFFRYPDKNMSWNDWLRVLVEDMLVIDAPTLYPRKTNGGGLHSLDIVDGATIKLLINNDGRTPIAPEPAYVQVIKGMPAVHYSTEELIYSPRNRRSWKMYGMSPVEQVIMTVNIALRRQLSQLQYYTEGNIPEALAAVPENWTPEQVKQMQIIWDSLNEGNQKIKRHLKFIPGGVDVKFTREALLKDMFDEWLARIICYAFSVSPQALVQMMNRATAESAAETAALEGLAPLQLWVKDLVNRIIEFHFGYDDLVFEWDKGEELDPKTQAEIHAAYITAGVLDTDEVRLDIGRDPRAIARPANASPTPGAPASTAPGAETGQQPPAGELGSAAVAAASGVGDLSTGKDGAPVPLDPNAPPPVPGTAPAGAAATGGSDLTIQDTAMNGTQISSLLEIVTAVANKELPEETARAMINAAFPFIKSDLIDGMLNGLANFEPPKPEPVVGIDGKPIAPPIPGAKAKVLPGQPADVAVEEEEEVEVEVAEKMVKVRMSSARREQLKAMTKVMEKTFGTVCDSVIKQLKKLRKNPKIEKAAGEVDPDWIDDIIGKLDLSGFSDASDGLEAALSITSTRAAERELHKIKSKHADALDLANTRAERWASNRAGELIKSNASGGELVDSTRDMIRSTITEAEENGWSNDRLASELEDSYGFSKQRARTIARTETKMADSAGSLEAWKSSGVKMSKVWVRSANDYDCDICEANESQGEIPLDADFDSGDDTAPAHPNCECVVSPVVNIEDQEL